MVVVSICYKQGVRFDTEYYFNQHMPMADRILKPLGLQRSEVRTLVGTAAGGEAPYQAIASLYFESQEAFQAAFRDPSMKEMTRDIKNFYDGAPEIWIGKVAL